jgi:NitT/TauT family transport system ATP-binding protein
MADLESTHSERAPEPSPAKIKLDRLCVSYPLRQGGEIEVIRDFTLEVYEGEFVCLVGASGCGKTTLLNVVAGLIPASSGRVFLDGRPVDSPGPDRAMVFQDDAVFPWYTVRENVEYPLKIAGVAKAEREQIVERYLKLVGLEGFEDMYPRELSGGMRKRVDVARAMAAGPEVLLMDEPFAALDVITKGRLQEEFLRIWYEARMTVLFVTHDLEEALFLAERVVVMASQPGRVQRVVRVPFAHPRGPDLRTNPEFQALRRELAQGLRGAGT